MLARPLRRLVVLALVITFGAFFVLSLLTNLRALGDPSHSVTASDGRVLGKLRQVGPSAVTLTEADLTAAFDQAVKLPTFPYATGQVAVVDGRLEVFGRLKRPAYTARLLAEPRVRDGRVSLTVTAVTIGRQSVPLFLARFLTLASIDQATLFAETLVPPIRDLTVEDQSITLHFR